MLRRYCPPTSNSALVICPSEQTRTASISTSNTLRISNTACCRRLSMGVEGIKAQVDDIRAKAAANGHSVKVGVNAFIIARDTEAEARAVLQEIIDKANPDAVNAFGAEVKNAGAASPEGEGNWAKSSFEDLVQYNDGFKTNLIGTPRQIAERIVALKAVGVDLILSGFLHFQEEVEYFGQHVLPLVRELEEEKRAERAVA
eukprot:gene47284-57916_t